MYTVYITACIFLIMSYTPGCLNDVMKRMEKCLATVFKSTKCKQLSDVKESALMKPDVYKKDLAGAVVSLVGVLDLIQNVLPSAGTKMEELQSELIASQKSEINLQNELISSRSGQLEAVQSTVKNEIKTYSDIVKDGCQTSVVTEKIIRHAVKSAVSEDQRHRNLLIFGLEEKTGENVEQSVNHVIRNCGGSSKVSSCHRIGAVKPGIHRAVKVSFASRDTAISVLAGAKRLKEYAHLKNVFISPDRSPEERAKRKQLVDQLKEKIRSEPGMYHYIQNGKLQSAQKKSRPEIPSTPTSARSNSSVKSTPKSANWADRFRNGEW